jgi:aryl-alcohol dehydrogenase-like predicted oxidoreductase
MPKTSELAFSHGVSIHRVLVAWQLSISKNLIPIVGARRPASILDSILGAELVLSDEDFAAIDGEATDLSERDIHL